MLTLAIDSATEACSVALFDGERLVAGAFRVLGRGHAELLVPMIAALPGKGRAQRIAVALGPGSFTGVRVGLAAARGLALAWRADLVGYPTLALVAAMARRSHPGPVTVCMTGGHGEWFVQDFGADGRPERELASLSPTESESYGKHTVIAGSQAKAKAALAGPGHIALDLVPDARFLSLLPRELLTSSPAPIYGRAPDARLPGAAR